jgi:MFS family permease
VLDSDRPLSARRQAGALAIASLTNITPAITVSTLGILLPEVRATLGLSEVEAGALFSAIFVVASVASPNAGWLIDRIGWKVVLLIGLTLLALGFALAALSSVYPVTLLLLGIAGVGYGFTTPASFALMSELLPGKRGLAMGIASFSYGVGTLAGPLLASLVTVAAGWRASFLAVGLIGIAIALVEAIGIEPSRRAPGSPRPAPLWRALNRNLVLLALAELFAGSVFWSTISWAPTVLRSVKALTLGQAGVVMGMWGAAPMVGSLVLGALSDRLGRKQVILWTAYPNALVVVIIYHFLDSAAPLAMGFTLFGFLNATFPALVVALAQESARPEAIGTASGIVMSLHYVSAVLAPLVTARLLASTWDVLWAIIAVTATPLVLYASLVAPIRVARRTQPKRP